MSRTPILCLAPLLAVLVVPAHADPVSEAQAVGQASVAAVNSGMRDTAQPWQAEAVAASPGGTLPGPEVTAGPTDAYYGLARAADCASNASSAVECEAINTTAQAMQPAEVLSAQASEYADVDQLRSGQLDVSAATGVPIGGTYECTSTTETHGSIRHYAYEGGKVYECHLDEGGLIANRYVCCPTGSDLLMIPVSTGLGTTDAPRCVVATQPYSVFGVSMPLWLDASDPRLLVEDNTWTETTTTCKTTPQDIADSTWEPGNAPDTDLATVVAFMEAGREAGAYMDPKTLEIFKGFGSSCREKLWGAVDCCAGAAGSGSGFSNAAIGALSAGGNAMASTYTYDALFASSAPDMVISGFSSLFGSGTSSSLAGFLAGDVSVESFLQSLVPGPWTVAMLALQFSGLMDCRDNERETAMRKDAKLCVGLGSYCSKKVLFGCLERSQSYCCFNSVLAKLINTQGKAQLGKSMGSAKSPNCGGFTPEELQQLDLAAMDLSEFLEQVKPKTDSAAATTATSCYFAGDTSCPAVH